MYLSTFIWILWVAQIDIIYPYQQSHTEIYTCDLTPHSQHQNDRKFMIPLLIALTQVCLHHAPVPLHRPPVGVTLWLPYLAFLRPDDNPLVFLRCGIFQTGEWVRFVRQVWR